MRFVFLLAAFGAFAADDESTPCGKHWVDEINGGRTVAVLLQFGAPVALYTEGSPTLAGCAPSVGLYSEGQKLAKLNFSYADSSFGKLPLIEKSISNDSAVASYIVTYEPQVNGSYSRLRPKNVTIINAIDDDGADGADGNNYGRMSYDEKGRIVRIDWTYNAIGGGMRFQARLAPFRLRRERKVTEIRTPTRGYDKFVYGDDAHPTQATYYESLDQDGLTSAHFKYGTNKDGLLTDVSSPQFENATCPDGCVAPASCCRDFGSNATGTCYSSPSCDALGGTSWHYEYDSKGRVAFMNESGVLQSYRYDEVGRLIAYSQPLNQSKNATLFSALYEGGEIKMQLFFVLYPIFPEVWGFDPPAQKPYAQYV